MYGDEKKMPWFCWNKVMLDKEDGGVWVSVVKCCSNLNLFGIDLNEIMHHTTCRWAFSNRAWVVNWDWCMQPTERFLGDIISILNIIDCLVIDAYKEDEWAWKIENSGLLPLQNLAYTRIMLYCAI
ncbi:hypothetical protein CTI12_AA380360 [Artemisia annua]|uniref:RNA-directed DNA polymerase, eukaryota, Reverse transcriptase zinc-binding domain protein n=1 Tax=Artemisia annua TaxID=35608 RepID=A0A2U1MG24_ARTAN|nr:hypothetical protein CTI12_AA380360 [Artemisia annua]